MKYRAQNLQDIATHFKSMAAKSCSRADLTLGSEKKLLAREHVTWLKAADFLENCELEPKDDAASDLVEALKSIVALVTDASGYGQYDTVISVKEIARAAIAKEEVKTP